MYVQAMQPLDKEPETLKPERALQLAGQDGGALVVGGGFDVVLGSEGGVVVAGGGRVVVAGGGRVVVIGAAVDVGGGTGWMGNATPAQLWAANALDT
jgi:hypothetical protein